MLAITKASADQPVTSSPIAKEITDFPILGTTPSPQAIVLGDSYQDTADKQAQATLAAERKHTKRTNESPSDTLWIGQTGPAYWSCVECVERKTGINMIVGVAENWPINSQEGKVGAVVILAEGSVGHVATEVEDDSDSIIVYECNYIGSTESTRRIRKDSNHIRGYYLP